MSTPSTCPFCAPDAARIFHAAPLILGLWDAHPVTPGHALLVPKRHTSDWFDATSEEQHALLDAIAIARKQIEASHKPDGYNIGINVAPAAGQTVRHVHVHVIPRYAGDVPDPRGGVRHVIPSKGNYLVESKADSGVSDGADHPYSVAPISAAALPYDKALIRGETDSLLEHILDHIDGASRVDIAVAFILFSGVQLIEEHLTDLLSRGGRARILTGDYLDATDPNACQRLLDLREHYGDQIDLRVFETVGGPSFHPKAYLFYPSSGEAIAYVGSSNLTRTALKDGVEWNFRVSPSPDPRGIRETGEAFEALFAHKRVRPLDAAWLKTYRKRHKPGTKVPGKISEPPPAPFEPHEVQQEALVALQQTRAEGNTAGLVVMATGLGKTWLAAFDSTRAEFRRILFVAHREEILNQALRTFRNIRRDATFGLYNGDEKRPDADILFASVQTLARKKHLKQFGEAEFDYIIVDEFHHASASTYRKVIDHFQPKFLLGLTATPERTDGGDLLALCQENLVYRCDLADGISRELLSPFHYFGIPDSVDYSNIPWRSSRFDEAALTTAVATTSRAQNALEQHETRGGTKTLAFCCSKRHADFMSAFFNEAGVRSASVHSGDTAAPRAASLEKLSAGELDVVFAVDMFNEGVDVPAIDTILMLRPTESRILFLQQLGRGLRKAADKSHLTIIDYIGNHRSFLLKPQTLFGLGTGDQELSETFSLIAKDEIEMPPGCSVTYELEALDLLRSMLRLPKKADALRAYVLDFVERHGQRPRAVEAYHDDYNPRSARKAHGSWLRFASSLGHLSGPEQACIDSHGDFLDVLETTQMTKSFKMLVLLAMLNDDAFPGSMSIGALRDGVVRIASRSANLRAELGDRLDDAAALRQLLEQNPIAAWVGARGTGGVAYFEYDGAQLRATMDVADGSREVFQELTREIVDCRLAEYLDRLPKAAMLGGTFKCKVSHANGRPMLFLPNREVHAGIPHGLTPLYFEGERFIASFVKVALNVVQREGGEKNEFPSVLRKIFGPDAGLPGTHHEVILEPHEDGYELKPWGERNVPSGVELWRSYAREQLPGLLSMRESPAFKQTGFVHQDDTIVLLVTLNKSGHQQAHKYADRFVTEDHFQWQSQNRTTQRGKPGQAILNHEQREIPVHLFVRKDAKIEDRAAPFVYCGKLQFQSWEDEKPITVQWKLSEALPERLRETFVDG